MKQICTFLLLCCCFDTHARLDVIDTLFMTDQPVYEEMEEDSFKMSSELGFLMSKGNTRGTTIKGRLTAKHNMQKWYNSYVADLLYSQDTREIAGEDQRVTSAHKAFVSMQSDYKLKDRSQRIFVYGEYEDDRFNRFDYQAALAVGWTNQVWDTQEGEFRYSIGPGYAVSRLGEDEEGVDQMGLIVRAALEYEKKLTDSATFRQFFSTEADDDFSRSVSETSLAAKINGALAMKLSLNMIHNTSPDHIGSSLDTESSVTLVYQFF